MPTPRQVKEFLRTNRGQLTLFAITFAVAWALAIGIALYRPFFEKYVREKYQPIQQRIFDIAKRAETKEVGLEIGILPLPEQLLVYETWMQCADQLPKKAAWVLAEADAELYLRRAYQTIVAGSPEQRRLAIRFLKESGHKNALYYLQKAFQRAQARREQEDADYIRFMIGQYQSGG